MKRLILSTMCMLFCATGLWALNSISGIYYYLNAGTQTASVAHSDSYSGSKTIPSTVTYGGITYSVTSIGEDAFSGCTGLTSITIPNSVTSIGSSAFSNCTGLTSITIPNSVTSIGSSAFENCTGLTSITIPNSVTSIGSSAFSGCGITVYNAHIFAHLPENDFGTYSIPEGIETIVSGAFSNCTGLTSVTIPNSVTSIGSSAFENCSGLKEVINKSDLNITQGSTANGYVAYYADYVCNGGKTVIGDFIFSDRDKTLVKYTGNGGNITLPENFNGGSYTIGASAFSGNTTLTSITIPNSVTSIGSSAFENCSGLTSIDVAEGNANYTSIDGVLYDKEKKTLIKCPQTKTSIEIQNSVTDIGSSAFYNCSGLTSVEIPSGVTDIGSSAFYNCSGLTSVEIPSGVTGIENSAFYNVRHIVYTGSAMGSPWGAIAINGFVDGDFVFSDNTKTRLTAYIGNGGDVTIPSSVTTIGNSAFYNCSRLTSIEIPNSVTSIEEYAFYDCSELTSVTLPNSVTSIGSKAFYNCSGLKEVINKSDLNITQGSTANGYVAYYADYVCNGGKTVIGDFIFSDRDKTLVKYIGNGGNITLPENFNGGSYTIGASAFSGNTTLTSITIPNSVTSIGNYAFKNCSGLTSITIPNSVTSIGGNAFERCIRLTSITIPNSVTSIGNYVFKNCSGLTSVTIPNSVTSIGSSAFENCTGLTIIAIPSSVTSIGSSAFKGCARLKRVINKSALNITKGSTANGYVAYYADIVSNEGTVIGDFIFSDQDKILVEYIGNGEDITLPENFNGGSYTIGASAFSGNTTLTSIVISNSVTSIVDGAFSGCSRLTSIIVPCEKYDYFKEAISQYASIIYENCTFEITTNVNNENYGTVTNGGTFSNETIQITATPNDHYHFVKWNDDNTENPRTVQVTQDSTFTAIFAIDEHNVTLSKNISAAGTVTGDGVYEHNTTVQLTATANEGYRFKGWSDGVTEASREITVTKDTSITANFVALYTIKALASASQGTVIGGGVYEDGETVTLVANPNSGYIFAQWVDGSDENPRTVTVDENKTYTAYFIEGEQDKYMITWKNWDGRVIKTSEVSYGEVPVFNGEKPTRPDEAGYTFTFNGWSPTIAAASQNAEYTANYIQTATEAEKTTIENEGDISITTTDNTALFTWPENASADTYTLTITRNDEVFCSLTFDGQGRLINLNFPNLRASAEGYQFTVTGLNSGTDYAYDLKAKDGAATVNEYTGEFRTSDGVATAAPEAEAEVFETARYDINGRPLNAPIKGVNIVKYSDGSVEKELVR